MFIPQAAQVQGRVPALPNDDARRGKYLGHGGGEEENRKQVLEHSIHSTPFTPSHPPCLHIPSSLVLCLDWISLLVIDHVYLIAY